MDPTLLIGDIVERDSDDAVRKPVTFDDVPFTATPTGFPKNRRRWRPTKKVEAATAATAGPGHGSADTDVGAPSNGFDEAEKRRIDAENRQRISDMTPEEIAQAQDDIMSGLNPALVQKLLRRANIDAEPNEPAVRPPQGSHAPAKPSSDTSDSPAEVGGSQSDDRSRPSASKPAPVNEDEAPSAIPADLFPITSPPQSTHFPTPPKVDDLDPSDPNFLENLQKKYFPDLPADPSKMAWMAPIPTQDSIADKESPYYPHDEISVAALRFDFRGRFLSPRVSRKIPTSKGLHHHGLAPEAAGYTVAELAHLARSAVPSQRCMAFQMIGRILYRLGLGEWGKTQDHPIAMGIWQAMKEGRVLDSLIQAATVEGGHQGSRAYAMEALWLFEKGGWKESFQGR